MAEVRGARWACPLARGAGYVRVAPALLTLWSSYSLRPTSLPLLQTLLCCTEARCRPGCVVVGTMPGLDLPFGIPSLGADSDGWERQ